MGLEWWEIGKSENKSTWNSIHVVDTRTSHTLSVELEHPRKRPPSLGCRPCGEQAPSWGLPDRGEVPVVPCQQNLPKIRLWGARGRCPRARWGGEPCFSGCYTATWREAREAVTGQCLRCCVHCQAIQGGNRGAAGAGPPAATTHCGSQDLQKPTLPWCLDAAEAVCAAGARRWTDLQHPYQRATPDQEEKHPPPLSLQHLLRTKLSILPRATAHSPGLPPLS